MENNRRSTPRGSLPFHDQLRCPAGNPSIRHGESGRHDRDKGDRHQAVAGIGQPTDTEDQVFRLRLAHELKLPPPTVERFAQELLGGAGRRGGCAKKAGDEARCIRDRFRARRTERGRRRIVPALRLAAGLEYLLQTQKPDGSWQVESRAKPLQEYFESGFPHGKDQFISAFATGWATEAMLIALANAPLEHADSPDTVVAMNKRQSGLAKAAEPPAPRTAGLPGGVPPPPPPGPSTALPLPPMPPPTAAALESPAGRDHHSFRSVGAARQEWQ